MSEPAEAKITPQMYHSLLKRIEFLESGFQSLHSVQKNIKYMEERMSICESNVIAINETFLSAQQKLSEMVQKTVQEVELKIKTYGIQPKSENKALHSDIAVRRLRSKEIRIEEFNSLVELVNLNDQKVHKKIESKFTVLELAAKQLSQHVKTVQTQQQLLQSKISEQQDTLVSLVKQSSTLREAISAEVEESDEFKKKLKVALDKMNAKIHDNILKMNECNQQSLQLMNNYKESLEKLHQLQIAVHEAPVSASPPIQTENITNIEEVYKLNNKVEQIHQEMNEKVNTMQKLLTDKVEDVQKQLSQLDDFKKQFTKVEDTHNQSSKIDDMQKQLTSTQIQVSNFKEMLNFVKNDVMKDPKLFEIVDKRYLVQFEPLQDRLEHMQTQLDNICHEVWYGELLHSTDPLDNVIFHELKKMNFKDKIPLRKVKRGVYKIYEEFIVVSVIEDYVFATINNQHLLFQAFIKQRLTKWRQIDGFQGKATPSPVSLNVPKVNSQQTLQPSTSTTSGSPSKSNVAQFESKIPVLQFHNNVPTVTASGVITKEPITGPLSARRVEDMVKSKDASVAKQPLSARSSPRTQKVQHLSINLQPNNPKSKST